MVQCTKYDTEWWQDKGRKVFNILVCADYYICFIVDIITSSLFVFHNLLNEISVVRDFFLVRDTYICTAMLFSTQNLARMKN